MRPDVIVAGLGSMGAATACELAARGVRVLGLDRFAPPHTRGAHAGGSRIIRMAYAEGSAYVPLVRRAYELWQTLEGAAGTRLLSPTGGLMLGRPDSLTVRGASASAQAHGLAHEMLDAVQVRRRFPAFTPADDEVALYEEATGLLRPERAIAAQLLLAGRAGADLRYGAAVTGWRATADGVTVTTATGTHESAHLILCPGAWAPELLADLGVPMVVRRRVQHYWRSPGGDYAAGRFPSWMWEYGDGAIAYGLPAPGGEGIDRGVKAALHHASAPVADPPGAADPVMDRAGPVVDRVGASVDRAGPAVVDHAGGPVDPDVGAGEATPAEVRAMRGWLATRLPALAASDWLGSKPCLYTLTPDEDFVVGRHPRHERVTVACGFSGHGFKFAPVVGEILADLALDGSTAHPITMFAPDRFI